MSGICMIAIIWLNYMTYLGIYVCIFHHKLKKSPIR